MRSRARRVIAAMLVGTAPVLGPVGANPAIISFEDITHRHGLGCGHVVAGTTGFFGSRSRASANAASGFRLNPNGTNGQVVFVDFDDPKPSPWSCAAWTARSKTSSRPTAGARSTPIGTAPPSAPRSSVASKPTTAPSTSRSRGCGRPHHDALGPIGTGLNGAGTVGSPTSYTPHFPGTVAAVATNLRTMVSGQSTGRFARSQW